MRRPALIGLFFLLAACEKEPVVVSVPSPTPPPAPTIRPKPAPTPKPTGWVAIQTSRWQSAQIRPEKVHFVNSIVNRIIRNRARYEVVAHATGVPWQVIGVIHNMEGSLDFRTNLGQGDPLTAQSRNVPKNRPPVPPKPPFSWEYAAEDSIRYDHLDRESWTVIGQELQNIEAWNGLGYQKFHSSVPTPYLWSWSTISKPGKYVADGKWSSSAISQQCGVVPILKLLP